MAVKTVRKKSKIEIKFFLFHNKPFHRYETRVILITESFRGNNRITGGETRKKFLGLDLCRSPKQAKVRRKVL